MNIAKNIKTFEEIKIGEVFELEYKEEEEQSNLYMKIDTTIIEEYGVVYNAVCLNDGKLKSFTHLEEVRVHKNATINY
jgi:hypothetical protein